MRLTDRLKHLEEMHRQRQQKQGDTSAMGRLAARLDHIASNLASGDIAAISPAEMLATGQIGREFVAYWRSRIAAEVSLHANY